jgi:hypothetical protein
MSQESALQTLDISSNLPPNATDPNPATGKAKLKINKNKNQKNQKKNQNN